jgi:hypothetical protein
MRPAPIGWGGAGFARVGRLICAPTLEATRIIEAFSTVNAKRRRGMVPAFE